MEMSSKAPCQVQDWNHSGKAINIQFNHSHKPSPSQTLIWRGQVPKSRIDNILMEFIRVTPALQDPSGGESAELAISAISYARNATANTPVHTALVGTEVKH